MRTAAGGFVQGYSAQAVVADGQIVAAVEVTAEGTDFGWLCPMVNRARRACQFFCVSRSLVDGQIRPASRSG